MRDSPKASSTLSSTLSTLSTLSFGPAPPSAADPRSTAQTGVDRLHTPAGPSSEELRFVPFPETAATAKPDGRLMRPAAPAAAVRHDFTYSHRVDAGLPPLHATRKHDHAESAAFVANLTVGSAQKSATFEMHVQAWFFQYFQRTPRHASSVRHDTRRSAR